MVVHVVEGEEVQVVEVVEVVVQEGEEVEVQDEEVILVVITMEVVTTVIATKHNILRSGKQTAMVVSPRVMDMGRVNNLVMALVKISRTRMEMGSIRIIRSSNMVVLKLVVGQGVAEITDINHTNYMVSHNSMLLVRFYIVLCKRMRFFPSYVKLKLLDLIWKVVCASNWT